MREAGNLTFCRNCGNELKPGDEFCGDCGTPVAIQPQAPRKAVPPLEAKKPKRGRLRPVTTVVILVAIVIVALLFYSVLVPSTSCPAPSGYATYSASNPYFGFAYPTSWFVNYTGTSGGSQEVIVWSQPHDLEMVAGTDKGFTLAQEKASNERYYNLTSATVASATQQSAIVAGINATLFTYHYNCNLGKCTLYLYIFFQGGYAYFSMFATPNTATYSSSINEVVNSLSVQPGCPHA